MLFPYTKKDIDNLALKAPFLSPLLKHYGKIERVVYEDTFHAMIASIISQQLSTQVVKIIEERLFLQHDITPNTLSTISVDALKSMGLSLAKVNAIKALSAAIVENRIPFYQFSEMEDEVIISHLTSIKGIGQWTAQNFLIFGLKRKNVFMINDSVLKKALLLLQIEEFTPNLFSPYNTLAAFYLWALGNHPRYGCEMITPIGHLYLVEENKRLVQSTLIKPDFYIPFETPLLKEAKKQIDDYFNHHLVKFNLPYSMTCSPFSQAILMEMAKIPYGQISSYKQLAIDAGYPLAYRACGRVCNQNPLLLIFPCHRVLNNQKKLHGFAYGVKMKQALLDHEQSFKR